MMRKTLYSSAVLSISLLMAGSALAQTAGQLTEESYAPPVLRSTQKGLSIAGATTANAPQGADALYVTPSGLEVTGGLLQMAEQTAAIEAHLKNKRVTATELFSAAQDLEAAYAKEGFILARISLPPQTIEDHKPLKLIVTEGFIEDIDVRGLPEHIRQRIQALVERLRGKKGLTRQELERQILLAADTPGLSLSSTLKAGSHAGGSILLLTGQYKPVTVTTSLDNSLSKALGHYSVNLGADFNDLLGAGEVLYFRISGYPRIDNSLFTQDTRNRQLIAGMTMPLGTDGWWLNFEGVDSRTNPKSDLTYYIEDHYQRFTSNLGYHWIRSRNFNTSSTISFIAADADQIMHMSGTSDWTQDQLRLIQLSQRFDTYLPWDATLSGHVAATFGLDAFGARHGTTALPLSRDGAEPTLSKLEFSLAYAQALNIRNGQDLQLSITAKGQTSFGDSLMASEQMGLGGFDWLSAFNSGAIQGDSAAIIRTELAYPFLIPSSNGFEHLNNQLSPYIYSAVGVAQLEQPTSVERAHTLGGSFGVGLRYSLSEPRKTRGTNLSIEYAHGAMSGSRDDNRLNFRLFSSF